MSENKRTSLYNEHVKLGAKMVPFGGFEMPVSYPSGIQAEHQAVRNTAGLFDVSHMGEFWITGEGALDFLQNMTINDVSKLKFGDAQYSAMCYENGGIVDDLILYRKPSGYFMVINASNIDKDFQWLKQHQPDNVNLGNHSGSYSLIALQGPKSREMLSRYTDADLYINFYSYIEAEVYGHQVMLSRTGYTGELGFEIYADHATIQFIWPKLISAGATPCGLASRDVLRMEMKYCLYGNDINQDTNPIEAGLGWITALDKGSFIGCEVLSSIKSEKPQRQLITFVLNDRGIPRHGYEIQIDGDSVGKVTSGTQSMSLRQGIGLAYVKTSFAKTGQEIDIIIRDKPVSATIVKPPFVKESSILN